jgi:alpha-glucosidase
MFVRAFHEAIPGYFEDLNDQIRVKLALKADRSVRASVRIEPDNEEYLIPMSIVGENEGWISLEATFSKSEHIAQTEYLFKIVAKDDSCWLGSAGIEAHMPRNIHMFRYSHDRRLPTWSASQVFYQVFPERFANGDDSLSPRNKEYRYLDRVDIVKKNWNELPEQKTGGFEFFGGDLVGVKQKLGYLNNKLGVTALYLNPVFTSQSSHKYDTVDYYNVDPHFGGNEALECLIKDAHSRDMKIVLDAVINHTSVMHPWFQSAQNGNEIDQARYVFEGDAYGSWKNHRSLPTLDYSNPQVVDEMMTGDDSVIRHWLREPYNIDGWRMDVIHMLGEGKGAANNAQHVRTLRGVIKEENDQALLLGEHFFEATGWLQGDQEDCAMNYFGFAHPVRAFFAGLDIAMDPIKLTAAEFMKWLREARARISFDHQLLQFNQLDSHDTPRFLSMLDDDTDLLNASIGFLMSYVGTPCLYYGTEVGMTGKDDPGCRACFPWDESDWNLNVLEHTQRWISHRKSISALSQGAMVDLYAQGQCVAFARVLENQIAFVVLNLGDSKEILVDAQLPQSLENLTLKEGPAELQQSDGVLKIQVPAKSVSLWVS